MAEKEERILVSKWFPEHMSDDKTTLIIFQSQLNDKSMTRTEAVERMAKAICRQTNGGECTGCACLEEKNEKRCKEIYMDSEYIELAEAALDALLGGKNG